MVMIWFLAMSPQKLLPGYGNKLSWILSQRASLHKGPEVLGMWHTLPCLLCVGLYLSLCSIY